jgi:hypothetical protein
VDDGMAVARDSAGSSILTQSGRGEADPLFLVMGTSKIEVPVRPGTGRAFFKHAKCLKNEAKQKPRLLLCASKNCRDGNF